MGLRGFWRRLTGSRPPPDPDRASAPPEPEPAATLAAAPAPHDLRLIQFAPDAQAATLPERRRLLEILESLDQPQGAERVSCEEVLTLCERLASSGEAHQAIDLLRQLCTRLPAQPRLLLRLAELLYEDHDVQPALELLQQLSLEPETRVRAHFLLGDHYGREAELEHALEHYEAVVALDISTPRAKQRARDIRERLDRPLATAAPTLFGGEELGAGSRFLLMRELGRGGSGTVYLALDRQLDRRVAVKALHRAVRERPDARTHLFCEARIATALQDPGIVSVYDLDEQLDLVVMEYCAGGTLAEQLARGPLPASLALRRLAEVCLVLDRVHRCGVVHRDLKPGNLLSRAATRPGLSPLLITDFGIAHADREAATEPAAAGSLIYLSPQKRRGDPPEPRSDLYSCGVILIEMVLGRPPLEGRAALAGVSLVDEGEVWRELAERGGPLGAGLVALCRSLADPSPERRPPDAASLATAARSLVSAEETTRLAEELRRRAGQPPRSPAAARWLDEQLARLGAV